ncbi:MAG: PilZ domain-containing protein [Candidatus Omnitrophica bacterium]|nr:PilZ domain-containing protein [Candidatus Omnitrophota bacterium]
MTPERRNAFRWQLGRQTKLRLKGAESFIPCKLQDLNFKGMQIALSTKLPADKFFNLALALTDDFTLHVECWVAWEKAVDGHNIYGLYFTRIADPDKERLYKFMRQDFPQELNKQWWQGITLGKEEKGGIPMEDRRVFSRFVAKFPVRFIDSKEHREGRGFANDISAKGIGFTAKEELGRGTSLEMWLEIPDKADALYTRGEVVWSRQVEPGKYRIGVNLEKADFMGLSRVLRAG